VLSVSFADRSGGCTDDTVPLPQEMVFLALVVRVAVGAFAPLCDEPLSRLLPLFSSKGGLEGVSGLVVPSHSSVEASHRSQINDGFPISEVHT
jgi:hypothetical protein